ncbi:ABC transporter permease [Antribacter gilvus]|uniref:ABC transporter permease n=1 Tax=Antribacter gilvus TaxID=2304675 RepID=UPI000F784AF2|nr:ABC transporter permease [Antribacter gilvus]
MTWLSSAWPQVVDLTVRHLAVSAPAILLSIVLAVPLGRMAQRSPRAGGALLSAASVLYAVPALPLLIVVPVVLGIPLRSPATLVVALTVYGTALLVRTAADAFSSISDPVRQAAVSLGHSPRALFWRVELPLAVPVLVSGVRVVTVSTVGLATIGALVGIPSLGSLFTDGFQRGITAEVVTGIVTTVALALVLDAACLLAGRALTPWTRVGVAPSLGILPRPGGPRPTAGRGATGIPATAEAAR